MKHKLFTLTILVMLTAIITSCPSMPPSSGMLPAKTFDLVQNAVFEVVLEKSSGDSVVYEKEPEWDLVPFAIRSDKYYSIGTAFAVSKTELITAFHVIDLGFESKVFNKYFIRDSQKNVYEVDKITGGSNEKDYLIFTVKDRTFDKYFRLERNFTPGDAVFSVGNALGEGIVIRNGLVLGTVPEEDSGRWNLLKSSADGNPGNSGGPLMMHNGSVIAVVTALRENILYSTPIDAILDDDRNSLPYRNKLRLAHLLVANRLNRTFETKISLPDTYTQVTQLITNAYNSFYDDAMAALFDEAPEYLTGANSSYLLHSSLSTDFPEVSFVDQNDDNWKLSGFDKKTYNLNDNGQLSHAAVSGINFYKIKKPDSVSLEKICSDPKYIMDLILQNIRTDRVLRGSNRYRILSYGDPSSASQFKDVFGRTWYTAYWLIGFDDDVLIMYILPMPNGPVVVTTKQSSSFVRDYDWDLRKLCDHLFAAYNGSFTEWKEFIAIKKYIPDFLKDMRFEWNSTEQKFSFNTAQIAIANDKNIFEWNGNSELFLAPTWFKQENRLEFGIRKIILSVDKRGKDFFLLYRNIKPDSKLGFNALENWNDLAEGKFPFDEKPIVSARDNTGSIGTIIKAIRPVPDVIHSLYFGIDNPQNEENLVQRFNTLKEGISVIK